MVSCVPRDLPRGPRCSSAELLVSLFRAISLFHFVSEDSFASCGSAVLTAFALLTVTCLLVRLLLSCLFVAFLLTLSRETGRKLWFCGRDRQLRCWSSACFWTPHCLCEVSEPRCSLRAFSRCLSVPSLIVSGDSFIGCSVVGTTSTFVVGPPPISETSSPQGG